MIIRIAEPIELWDGTQPVEKSIEEFASERDWSLYDLRGDDAPPPAIVLAAFYGNRKGPKPRHHPRYVVFEEGQLLATGGRLEVSPATFTWPAEVARTHVDLLEHQHDPAALFASYDRNHQLVELPSVRLHIDMSVLAARDDAPEDFRAKVVERLRKLKRADPAQYEETFAGAEAAVRALLGSD